MSERIDLDELTAMLEAHRWRGACGEPQLCGGLTVLLARVRELEAALRELVIEFDDKPEEYADWMVEQARAALEGRG